MYKFQSKDFRCQTRDYLLNSISKFPSWMNALQMWNDCTEDKLTSILKAKFKAVLVRGAQDNKYSVANREIIFSKIENLRNILEKIGEAFLCNVEINSAPTYLNLENAVCLNLNISEKNITAASLQATVFGLMKGGKRLNFDIALSSEDEDASITPPKNFLKSNVETECMSDNSSSFLPNSDDELAKYLDSELIPDANIKKEKPEDPEYLPMKMIKKEKKGPSSHKRKQDGDEKKNGHKKKKVIG